MKNTALKTALGPLWKIYSNDSIFDISIDAFDDVTYYLKNEPKSDSKIFKSPKELEAFIGRIIRFSGKKQDESVTSYFLNLDGTTKINIVLPPLAVNGPAVVIRKLPLKQVGFDDLVKFKALDEEGKSLILSCIEKGKGILIAGNHGSGKTTLLNTFVNAIPQPKKVVTIERYGDLLVNRKNVCRLQAPNQKTHEMIELVSIAERLFPDYLVNSNFEGPEVMPFLEIVRSNCSGLAMITGENPLDALKRLETKAVLSSEGLSLEDARYAISQSFKHIVFQEKRQDGTRLVSAIGEIQYDVGELKLKIIYKR